MLQTADLTIKLNPADDVVIARLDISAGTELIKEGVRVAVNVPAGHKIAVRDIAEGQPVRRYNQVIGYSTKPIHNRWRDMAQIPARTAESDAISKDMQRRGFTFVGSTILYAFMQAVGMVNDHVVTCFRHQPLARSAGG